MDGAERTFSTTEIRQKRREMEQLLALQQRQLAALAKMDEAAYELEQVEREMEALSRGDTQPADSSEPVPPEPHAIGERSLKILKDQAGVWLSPREILAGLDEHGWVDTDTDHALQRLRHSLRRLALNNPNVHRNENGPTYLYRYAVPRVSSDAGAPVLPAAHVNGVQYPALQGGPNDR